MIDQLEHMCKDLRRQNEALAREVRLAGEQGRESFGRAVHALHQMHQILTHLSDQFERLTESIKKAKKDRNF